MKGHMKNYIRQLIHLFLNKHIDNILGFYKKYKCNKEMGYNK